MHDEPSPPPLRRFQDPTLCVYCHHQNLQGARYCGRCGKLLPAKVDVPLRWLGRRGAAAPSLDRDSPQDTTGSRWFALGKLFSAHGRIGRKDYWIVQIGGVVLYAILALGALLTLDVQGLNDTDDRALKPNRFGHISSVTTGNFDTLDWLVISGLFLLYALAVLFASIKRLHDLGSTGWWLLVGWVPGINVILLLLFAFRGANPRVNKYGPVNSGTPFPRLHPRDSHGSLSMDVAERQGRGWPVSFNAIVIGALLIIGVAITVGYLLEKARESGMNPAYWAMLGLGFDVVGAFFLSAEAMKVENLVKLRDRFLKPLKHAGLEAASFLYSLMGSGDWEPKDSSEDTAPAGWVTTMVVVVCLVVGVVAAVILDVDFDDGSSVFFIPFIGMLTAAVFVAMAQLGTSVVGFVDRHTPSGGCAIVGFLLFLVGASLQFYGTYDALGQ